MDTMPDKIHIITLQDTVAVVEDLVCSPRMVTLTLEVYQRMSSTRQPSEPVSMAEGAPLREDQPRIVSTSQEN